MIEYIYYETDSIPANMVHAGVVFALGQYAQADQDPQASLSELMSNITYIEDK